MPIDMQALARLGAQTQIAQLVAEIDALLKAFPDLGREPARPATATETTARKRGRARGNASASIEAPPAKRKRKRKPMPAAARKAVRKPMASYLGQRRESAAAPATEAVPAAASAPEPTTEKPAAKRTISAEGRARIAAAQRKRWAKVKRGKKR
jgi:hypothetical protein